MNKSLLRRECNLNNQLEKDGVLYLFEIQKNLKNNLCIYNLMIQKKYDRQISMINTDILNWAVFKESAMREILVDYKNQTINQCFFKYGLASFTAYLQ